MTTREPWVLGDLRNGTRLVRCPELLLACVVLAGACAPDAVPESSIGETHERFSTEMGASTTDPRTGHTWIMRRALRELQTRGILPSQMQTTAAQDLIDYGLDYADHSWDGLTSNPLGHVLNAVTDRIVPAGSTTPPLRRSYDGMNLIPVTVDPTTDVALARCNDVDGTPKNRCGRYSYASAEMSTDCPFPFIGQSLSLSLEIGARVGIGNGAIGDPASYFSLAPLLGEPTPPSLCPTLGGYCNYSSLTMSQPVRNNVAMLFRAYLQPILEYCVGSDFFTTTVQDFALDNLYHFPLADLALYAPDVGSNPATSKDVVLYPLLTADMGMPSITPGFVITWLSNTLQYQPTVGRTDFGAIEYGAILYQLARKFFAGSLAQPSLSELPKAGNDMPGWHTGGMYGNSPLNVIQLSFPHTYLGGNPFICSQFSDDRDPCADGKPNWPNWVFPTGGSQADWESALPGRSDRAALVYLGWAAHMIQDLSLPHHASNWTSQEHARQDKIGDLAAASDYSGTFDWDAELRPDVNRLVGALASGSQTREQFCDAHELGASQVRDGGLNWGGPLPAFLQAAKTAYQNRRATANVSSVSTADFASYARPIIKNAILSTINLLLCAPPPAPPACAPNCPSGNRCNSDGDCVSRVCTSGVCQPTTPERLLFASGQGGRIVAPSNQDGRIEIFYMLADNRIYHNWQNPTYNGWDGPAPMDAPIARYAEQIVAGRNHDGRLEVFYVGTNGAVYHNWQNATYDGWSGEQPLGGSPASQIAVGQNEDDRLEVFYTGRSDSKLYNQWQNSTYNGWSGESSLGSVALNLAVGRTPNERLHLFSAASNRQINHNWQVSPNGVWFGQVALDPGHYARRIAVGKNDDGRLEIFYVGTNGLIYHDWQNVGLGDTDWSGESLLANRPSQEVVVGQNQDGRLEVFYLGTDGIVYHKAQNDARNAWSTESTLGTGTRHQAQHLTVGRNKDGRLEVFFIGADGNTVYHRWQMADGSWSAEFQL